MGKNRTRKQRRHRQKPNWSRRPPGRPKKKKWMPPRIGRPNYDKFRANEIGEVVKKVQTTVDDMRIHEKVPGQPGRPPAKRRDLIKSLLFLEDMKCNIQKSPSILPVWKDALGIETIYAPRTLYKYRASPNMTEILKRLQTKSAEPLWMKETRAITDATGNPRSKGKTWRCDKENPSKFREYDKAHYIVGAETLVIPYTKVTRGTWSDMAEFGSLVRETIPDSNIEAVLGDSGYPSVENFKLAKELGVTPYLKPKDNAVFRAHPSNDYEKGVYFANNFPKRWKNVYRYRVKVECAINAKKAAFGDIMRGGLRSSRRNQELCRDIVHNFRMAVMDSYAC